ncbi:MAG: hypothetical protein H0W13_07260 [Nitrospirales bacterium]|nr:hypothetical protein [Nitrospirales bacterium]
MVLDIQWAFFRSTAWCLLGLWLLFGVLELAEQVHTMPEWATEGQHDLDLDEAALAQLATGLKSQSPTLNIPDLQASEIVGPEHFCAPPLWELSRLDPAVRRPPSLRLHQHISVYRI